MYVKTVYSQQPAVEKATAFIADCGTLLEQLELQGEIGLLVKGFLPAGASARLYTCQQYTFDKQLIIIFKRRSFSLEAVRSKYSPDLLLMLLKLIILLRDHFYFNLPSTEYLLTALHLCP